MTIICRIGNRGSGMTLIATYIAFNNWKAFGVKPVFDNDVSNHIFLMNKK